MRGVRRRLLLLLLLSPVSGLLAPGAAFAALPPIRHVFILVLENKDYGATFGPGSQAPYLAKALPSEGQLLTHYYGTGHESLDNYITMVSGQPPNVYTQADAPAYVDFMGTTGSDGVALGQGSIFPAGVKTVADQLEARGLTWKGYMEDMQTPCQHPAPGSPDTTQSASASSQYAMRHNPFMYFHSIIDRPAVCAANDVPLDRLQSDLASDATTPSLSFITPDLCSDGHDSTCADGKSPAGYAGINAFLQTWVPRITASPAFKSGLLIVTFDETSTGADSCCHEPQSPNTPNNGGPTQGNGGGRTGAVLLSPYIKPGIENDTPYNHYSLLRSVEDIFGLSHLAYAAQDGLKPFGDDVFNATAAGASQSARRTRLGVRVSGVPRRCVRRGFRARVRITGSAYRNAQAMVDRRRVARSSKRSFSVNVRTRGLRRGRHRLTVRASAPGERSVRRTVRFRSC